MPHPVRIPLPATRARRTTGALMAAASIALFAACSDAPTSVAREGTLSLGKAPAGPAVTSASPSYSRRDTTLNVHVFGSGFTNGAVAQWELRGVPDSVKVRTNSTTFVSATELVANITVSADADLAYWDITVMLLGGKKGVGTEKFEVTTAQILGSGIGGYVMGASEQVSAVGYGDLSGAWAYDNISGATVDLGAGQAWGIDPTGTTALGRDGNFIAVAWTRDGAGSWTRQTLPGISGSGGGNATSAAIASDGALLAGGWLTVTVSRNQVNHPVVWRRVNDTWDLSPTEYALPGAAASIYDVNEGGQAVGRSTSTNGTVRGVVWNNATTYALLDGIAYAINRAGTVVVGERAGVPVYWYRNGMTWTGNNIVGTLLPSLSSSCAGGRANDVNDAGIIVGYSCSTGGKNQGTVWRLDLSNPVPTPPGAPSRLSGLGQVGSGSGNTVAVAITSAGPNYFAVGYVATGNNVTVRWPIP